MKNTKSEKDGISVRVFVLQRLDNPTGPWSAVKKMFRLSFGAKSFTEFWRYWNPVHHYYLSNYIYKPVRKVLPRSFAVIITFVFCGFFLHDIVHIAYTGIPLITVWFMLLGIVVLIGEFLNMDLSSRSGVFRVIVNLVYLLATFEIARRLAIR
jgi:hypothetical protein